MRSTLKKLNKAWVNYVVIRNYEFLNNNGKATELDMAIDKRDVVKVINLLKKGGYKKRHWNFSEKHTMWEKDGFVFDIQVGGIYWNDMPYLDNSIFWLREKNNFFYTLCDEHMFVMYICHSILGKRYLKYEKEITQLMEKRLEWSLINKYLYKAFGMYASEIIESIKEGKFKYKLKYSIRFVLNHPFKFIKNSLRWVVWRLTL